MHTKRTALKLLTLIQWGYEIHQTICLWCIMYNQSICTNVKYYASTLTINCPYKR